MSRTTTSASGPFGPPHGVEEVYAKDMIPWVIYRGVHRLGDYWVTDAGVHYTRTVQDEVKKITPDPYALRRRILG